MNISELARRLKVTTTQLHEVFTLMGIDIGMRAIKIDDTTAYKVMKQWSQFSHVLKKSKKEDAPIAATDEPIEKKIVHLPPVITVRDFAVLLNLPVTRLIQTLMNNGILAAMNEKIDYDTAAIIAEDLGFDVDKEKEEDQTAPSECHDKLQDILDREKDHLIPRPPIVVVMGHVDHGKTRLLDAIRTTNVIAQEAGGITQHIGAYMVAKKMKKTGEVKHITFLDTPGHEAFTTMRSRGARVADIAVLVVAADDGVKPQTAEAIKIIKAAELPFVVAINKIDKPEANIDKVKRGLSDLGLIPEDWGGKTVCVPLSAKEGTGIEDLLETILLIAEIEKEHILANPSGATVATVVESHIDKHEGPVATILVQNGTLKKNDMLVIESYIYGKVRAMKDHTGRVLNTAPPSTPVKIIGFKAAPVIGYTVSAPLIPPKDARPIDRSGALSTASIAVMPRLSKEKSEKPSVNIIIKADTLGSLEALVGSLSRIEHPDVSLKIVSKDIGSISTADVLTAEATTSFVAGFHVTASQSAEEIASEKNVEIKLYKIIYELIDDVKKRLEGKISPELRRITLGRAKVIAIFRNDAKSHVLGGVVQEGVLEPGMHILAMRGEKQVCDGTIARLQSGKQEIKTVKSGQEFGMQFDGGGEIAKDDILVAYREDSVKRTLDQ